MSKIKLLRQDVTRIAASAKRPGRKISKKILSATLCLGASGNTGAAVLAYAPQPMATCLYSGAPGHSSWSNHTAAVLGVPSQNAGLTHATILHNAAVSGAGAPSQAMHWLPGLAHNAFQTNGSAGMLSQTAPGGSDINLYSPVAQFAAGSLAGFHTIIIDVGGKKQTIDFGTKLTGAELLAAEQVLSGAKQTLVVGAKGTATGGTFNLNSIALTSIDGVVGGSIGALDISHGVTIVDSLSALNLAGALVNYGTINIGASTAETINAASILNAGAIVSAKSGDLSLIATGAFANTGSIATSGNVHVSGAVLNNSGQISSARGNVVLSGASDVVYNGANGIISAARGAIDFNGSNITVNGGDFLSKQLNFDAGCGTINANIGQVTGVIGGNAGASHITAATQNLQLGNIVNAGDPTYYNTAGDITIDGTVSATGGADMAIIASGNIIANGGKIDTTQANGPAGNVSLIAGANFSSPASGASSGPDTTTTITLSNSGTAGNGSATGGYIDLSGITYSGTTKNAPLTAFTTAGSGSGNSGDVLMVAYAGSGANSGNIQATALASQSKSAVTINTMPADASANGGNVTIIGGGSVVSAQNISTGSNATVQILATAPSINGQLSILDGTVTGLYNTTGTLNPTNITVGAINSGTVTIATAGLLSQAKGGNITATNVDLTAAGVGSSKASFVTDATDVLTVNGVEPMSGTPAASYVTDGAGTADIGGVSTAPGQSITISEAGTNMFVGNLNYTNVTLVNNSKVADGGNITIDRNGLAGLQVGEVYSTVSTPTTALGTGTITITASGNISEGASADAAPVIVGKNVVLNSTAGSIGSSSQSVNIQGAFLTANASKGSVYIVDTVQTTLNAGSAATVSTAPGGGVYSVSGNGLAVAGVISGYQIALASGPAGILAINANVGSTKTNQVSLVSQRDIVQTNAKAVITSTNLLLQAPGSVGSAAQPIATKSSAMVILGNASTNAVGNNVFVTQNGNLDLLTAIGGTGDKLGSLNLTVKGSLTIGSDAVPANINYNQVNLNAPIVVIDGTSSSAITASNLTFTSAGALNITGTAPASFAVTNLTLNGQSSVTIGAKDGTLNPFNASMLDGSSTALASFNVNTAGAFTSPITNFATDHGSIFQEISIVAGTLVTTGAASTPVKFDVSGTTIGGALILDLFAAKSINIGTTAGSFQITETGPLDGLVALQAKGPINIDGSGLTGDSNTQAYFTAGSLNVGATTAASPIFGQLNVISPIVTVGAGSSLTATDSSVFTAKGALNISGAGTISAGNNLTLGSTTLFSGTADSQSYISTSVTLGAKDGSSNPLLQDLAGTGATRLQNLTVSATGAFTTAGSGITLSNTAPGAITITTSGIVVPGQALDAHYTLTADSTGSGVAPGNVTLNITGSQQVELGNVDTGSIIISAKNVTDATAGGNTVAVTTKGNLLAKFDAVTTSADSTINLTSTAGSFLTTDAGSGPWTTGPDLSLDLSGQKGIVVMSGLINTNITNLTLTSNNAAPLVLSGALADNKGNYLFAGIGVYDRNPNNGQSALSNIENLTINTANGINIVGTATISVAADAVMNFTSTGNEIILGGNGSIQPGTQLNIVGAKSVQLGTPNPQGNKNPFAFLSTPTDPTSGLLVQSSGTFTSALDHIYINATDSSMQSQFNSLSSTLGKTFSGLALLDHAFEFGFGSSSSAFVYLVVFTNPETLGPQIKAFSTTPPPIIEVAQTGTKSLTLGGNTAATSLTFNASIVGSTGGTIDISNNGPITIGDSVNGVAQTGISLAGPGSITVNSAQGLTVNPGSIVMSSSPTGLSLTGTKSLAVLDSTLLTNPSLSSITLQTASTKPFIVGATGTITNGTAGNIAAPVVTLLTASLTNNGTIDGVGSGSALTLGAPDKSAFIFNGGTGTFGQMTQFEDVTVTGTGNVTLGSLFTANTLLGSGAVPDIKVSAGGILTFAPDATGITVGADPVTGGGGILDVAAKTIAYKPAAGAPLFVTFDAAATGSLSQGAGSVTVQTASALTIGTAKGNIAVNVGQASDEGIVNLTSTAGALTVGGGAGLQGGVISLTGNNVAVNAQVYSTVATVIATNGKAGTGVITEGISGDILTNSLSLSQGSAKLATTELSTEADNLYFNGGAFNIRNFGSASTMHIGGASGGTVTALTLNTVNMQAGGVTVIDSISSTNGSINIVDGSDVGHLQIADGATFNATNGSILMQVANDAAGASINVGSGVTMHGSSTTAGVGQVALVIGTVPTAANLVAGLTPGDSTTAPLKVETVGGNIYFGDAGNTGGTYTPGKGDQLSALGRNIIINQGISGGSITLEDDVSITADPPVGDTVNSGAGTSAAALVAGPIATGAVAIPVVTASAAVPSPVINTAPGQSTDVTAGLSNARLSGLEAKLFAGDGLLRGGVEIALSKDASFVSQGVSLICPVRDTIFETKFGPVSVASGAVVLLMVFDGGVAVYNLHDHKKGDVVIEHSGENLKIAPGHALVMTNRAVGSFEEINPAQAVGYRNIVGKVAQDTVKIFQGEFYIPSMLQTVTPLKQFVVGGGDSRAKAAKSILKTSAVLSQVGGAIPYQLMTAPRLTAMAR